MSDLKCDMCGKEVVGGKRGHCYVKSGLTKQGEQDHWEGWLVLGPRCLGRMKSIADRNCMKVKEK